jgi:methionyl-tRNA formyltransferase
MDIDLIITCAYGQILPQELLDIPHYGSINVHASLLPKYRGSAPINWAIMNGDTETGISLMYMDAGMDTGDIIDTIRVKINQDETYGELYKTLSILGKNMLESNLDYLVSGKVKRLKQDEEFASMAPMIKRNIEKIDFKENGQRIIDKIRGLNPEPLAYFLLDGEEIKIAKANFLKEDAVVGKIYVTKKSLAIGCIDGKINLLTIKKSGKKEMDIKSFLNGVNQEKIINSIIQ